MTVDKSLESGAVKIKFASNKYRDRKIYSFGRVGSTQIIARNLARKGAADGTVILASSQFCGRGRMKRVWESASDTGLYLSILLRPSVATADVAQLSLVTAIAIVNAIKEISGLKARIKWPNDIMYGTKKLCGILSEAAFSVDGIDYVIVGAGVNLNQKHGDFPDTIADAASSLLIETGTEFDSDKFLISFLDIFDCWYDEWQRNGAGEIIKEWTKHNCTVGRKVTVYDDGRELCSGLAVAVDITGNLIIKDSAGEIHSFNYGEISAHID